MSDIILGIRITADGKELVGAVTLSQESLKKLREEADRNTASARKLNEEQKNLSGAFNRLREDAARQAAALTGNEVASRALYATLTRLSGGLALVAAGAYALWRAYSDGEREVHAMNNAIALTGNFAGTTRGQMLELARVTADAGAMTISTAKQVVTQLVASGQIGSEALGRVARLAEDYAAATGRQARDIAPELVKLFADPAKGAEQLNRQYHFLSVAQIEHIRQLERIGETGRAQVELADALTQRLPRSAEQLGVIERAWASVRQAASSAWDAMLGVGRTKTLDQEIAEQAATVAGLSRQRGVPPAVLQAAQTRLQELQWQREADASGAAAGSSAAAANARSHQAQALLRGTPAYRTQALRDQLALLASAEGLDPTQKAQAEAGIKEQIAKLQGGGPAKNEADAFTPLLERMRQKLVLDKESTEMARLQLELTEKKYAKLTPAQELELNQLAKAIDQKTTENKLISMELDLRRQVQREEAEATAVRVQLGQQAQAARNQMIDSTLAAASAAEDELKLAEYEISLMGRSAAERRELIAGLRAELDMRRQLKNMKGLQPGDEEGFVDSARQAAQAQARAQSVRQEAEESRRFWQGIADNIERALTDSVMRGFERGESFAKNFGDSIKRYFQSLVIQIPIRFLSQAVTGMLAGAFPGIAAAGGGGGGGLGGIANFASLLPNVGGGGSLIGNFAGSLSGFFGGGGSALAAGGAMDMGIGFGGATLEALGMGASSIPLSASIMPALGPIGLGLGALALGSKLFGGGGKTPAVGAGVSVTGSVGRGGWVDASWLGHATAGSNATSWSTYAHGPNLNPLIADAYRQVEGYGRLLGLDTAAVRNAVVPLSFRTGQSAPQGPTSEDVMQAFNASIGQVTEALARRLIPNIDALARAGESAVQTLERLAQEARQAALNRMGAAIGLEDSTRDLWLTELSPLTARERLDRAGAMLGEYAAGARGGDIASFGKYGSGLRTYLTEASRFYGTSTADYRGIFEARQAESADIVGTTLNENAMALASMGGSLEQIVGNTRDLDKRIAAALERAIGARIDTQIVVQQAAAQQIVQAVQSAGTGAGPAWIDEPATSTPAGRTGRS
ncbi:MAG: phage tail length tape measure family protein [Burkholderiales bacterium]|nr:phage tail length tape measure family protein [Burkholderiales bacterium]